MKRISVLLFAVCFLSGISSSPTFAVEPVEKETTPPGEPNIPQPHEAKKHPVLMYIPNRIFDLLDIVRARIRLGPGISVGARATSMVQAFIGSHSSAFVGLYGPRGKPLIPWVFGIENRSGIDITDPEKSANEKYAPYFDPMEVEAEAQAVLAGVSVGVAPLEVLDFLSGLLFIDLKGDDF